MQKKYMFMYIFVPASLVFFILCWSILRFSDINILTSPIGNTIVTILGNANLLGYRSYIGGHSGAFSFFRVA